MLIYKRTALADKVLTQVIKRLKDGERSPQLRMPKDTEISISPYLNGRECGWMVRVFLRGPDMDFYPAVAFSENRNSDECVVYPGTFRRIEVDAVTVPANGGWERRRYFPGEAVDQAAEHAYAELLRLVGECQRRSDEIQAQRAVEAGVPPSARFRS